MASPASLARREVFHPELARNDSMSCLMFMVEMYQEVNNMASCFTNREMTGQFFDASQWRMGLLEDALEQIRDLAVRDYGSLSGLARHLGKQPNTITRWYAADGKQARRPKLETIAPILEILNFQLVPPGEKPKVSTSQDDIDRIWGAVSRIMRQHGVDRETIDEVGDVILGSQKRNKQYAAGE